jgi:hypothetical protein
MASDITLGELRRFLVQHHTKRRRLLAVRQATPTNLGQPHASSLILLVDSIEIAEAELAARDIHPH